ncbi:polysaccharide pyruvyl transferase family protein [Paraclostridium bifermentans]|uniref:polysaccharide pyruvyl transferase family protein n=1 Tax=Paraclostridium bifermentans TaxID=1490 RepID=UPI00189E2E01|nr:polysaccharide pyruvyl transferase family protein [Paraclostridium bifermentans]
MKIMMFAHAGSLNRGCEAIVRSSSEIIKDKISNAEIILASNKPDTDKIIKSVDSIFDGNAIDESLSFFKKIIAYTELKISKSQQFVLTERYKNVVNKINDVDVCLSIGGDNYCYGEQEWLYAIDKNIKKKGKKLVLWACSIGEEDLSELKINDLKTFDLILARETLTYNVLTSKGLTNVKLVADPAFTMVKEELPLPQGWKDGDTIGLNFSPLVLERNPKAIKATINLMKYILEKTESVIALTPHVMEIRNDDSEILNKLYEQFKNTNRVILLPNNLTAIQYKGYIARMRFFIGARTHATIAAYSNYVPTMVLGYSIKSRGIAKDLFGEEKLVLGIKDISNTEKLTKGFDELLREEESIKRTLKNRIPEIKKMSYKSAEYLKEIVC